MPYVKGNNPTPAEEKAISYLTNLVNPAAIAMQLVEEMVDRRMEITKENAERVYCFFIEQFGQITADLMTCFLVDKYLKIHASKREEGPAPA